jgi:peptidoglycan/LPS O-acetylase OafA/YrhL
LILSLVLIGAAIGQKTGTHWDVALPVTNFGLLTHLLLIQDIFPSTYGQINHGMWSISVEWRIYFLFPLLLLSWRRLGAVVTTVATIVLSFALSHKLHNAPIAYSGTVEYVGLFAMGMLGADIVFRTTPPDKVKARNTAWIATFFISTAILAALAKIKFQGALAFDFFFSLSGMSLLIITCFSPSSPVTHFLSWKPIRSLGLAGYSLYLIHAPLLQLIQQYLLQGHFESNFTMFWALVFIGIPLILLATWGFFIAVEHRFVLLNQKISADAQLKQEAAQSVG